MATSIGDNEIITLQRYVNDKDRAGYYNQLDQWGYEYGNLAGAVVDSSFASGRLANSSLVYTASYAHNVTIDASAATNVGIRLMELDFAARSNPFASTRSGVSLSNNVIQNYHEEAFIHSGLE